jgi:hypothetical protein
LILYKKYVIILKKTEISVTFKDGAVTGDRNVPGDPSGAHISLYKYIAVRGTNLALTQLNSSELCVKKIIRDEHKSATN